MCVLKAFHVSESFYEPIIDVGPSQGSLNGLHNKDKVCYADCLIIRLRRWRNLLCLPMNFTTFLSFGKLQLYTSANKGVNDGMIEVMRFRDKTRVIQIWTHRTPNNAQLTRGPKSQTHGGEGQFDKTPAQKGSDGAQGGQYQGTLRLLLNTTPKSTHILAILGGIGNGPGAMSEADIKEVEINDTFLGEMPMENVSQG